MMKIAEWFFPVRSFRKARQSIADAKQSVVEALTARNPSADTSSIDIPADADAKKRFEAMAKLYGWTDAELREQLRAVRATKVTALALTGVAFIGSLGAMVMVPLWMLFFVLPLGGSVTILCAAQAFRYALWEAQLVERAFIDAKTFVRMPDFWRRLIS